MKTNITFDSAGLHWIEGASHNDLYDRQPYVTPTVAKLTEFCAANLAEAALA